MGAAVLGVDAVGESQGGLGEALVVLQRRLHLGAVHLLGDVYRVVEHLPPLVEEAGEAGDAPLEVERDLLVRPVVLEVELHPLGQVAHLAEALRQQVEVVVDIAEYLLVGEEGGGGARTFGLSHIGHPALGDAAAVLLAEAPAIAPHLDRQLGGEGVDHRGAHAVEAAGYLVTPPAELAAGVQRGHHRLQRRGAGDRVVLHRYAAAVIRNRYPVVLMDDDLYAVAPAGQRLVDAVVRDLLDQVMQPARPGGTDVHAGTAAHRLHPAQNLDVFSGVLTVANDYLVFSIFLFVIYQ